MNDSKGDGLPGWRGRYSESSGPNPAAEKRQNARFAFTEPVRVYKTDGSNRMSVGVCRDLSMGGVGIQVDTILAVGEVVELVFSRAEVRQRARVIYRNLNVYGLAFLRSNNPPEAQAERI
ncbi:MAG: PilZ domain-containing protein [Terriglobales bacterium]